MAELIRIRVEDAGVQAYLAELARRCADRTPAMREIASIMTEAVGQNFEEEGRPRWPALAASTVRSREAGGYWPGKMLQVTGQLAASIGSRHDADSAEVGSNKVYAAMQQFGGRIAPRVIKPRAKGALYWPGAAHPVGQVNHPGATIPPRPFLSLAEDDLERIREALGRYVAAG